MSSLAFEVVLPHRCLLGEGPVWDERRNSISWLDILKGEIHEYQPLDGLHHIIRLDQMVGAITLCNDENWLLAAMQNGLYHLSRDGGEKKLCCDLEAALPENRFNDGKCDSNGRLWLGSLAISEQAGAGNLYRIKSDFSNTIQIPGTTISNGLAWSPDNKTFYHIDTPTRQVMAYDFDPNHGNLSNGHKAVVIPEDEGFPDGMTIDNEGMLWIAHWDGWQVSRWNPHTGAMLLSIALPAAKITSCTFGGPNLEDLYITSASKELSPKQKAQQPLAGALFVVKNCGFKGIRTVPFAGL